MLPHLCLRQATDSIDAIYSLTGFQKEIEEKTENKGKLISTHVLF